MQRISDLQNGTPLEFHMARIASKSFQFIEFIGLFFLAFGQDVGTDLGCHGSIFIFFDESVIDSF